MVNMIWYDHWQCDSFPSLLDNRSRAHARNVCIVRTKVDNEMTNSSIQSYNPDFEFFAHRYQFEVSARGLIHHSSGMDQKNENQASEDHRGHQTC